MSLLAAAPTTVCNLDAIHLTTALRLGEQLTSFVTYDKWLADVAHGAGLRVDMPEPRDHGHTTPLSVHVTPLWRHRQKGCPTGSV
jgi:hypothetical protein